MKTLVLIALVVCSLGILMQAVASEEPFETDKNPLDEEEGYEVYEDANAPDYSDSDEEEDKGRYEERMNAPGDSDDDDKEEKEQDEERMNEVTNGEDEVLEKPEDAVDDPESVNSIPADPKWQKRRRRRRQYNYRYRRSRRVWGKK